MRRCVFQDGQRKDSRRGRDGGVHVGIQCLRRRKHCGRESSERRRGSVHGPNVGVEEECEEGQGWEARSGRKSDTPAYPRCRATCRFTTGTAAGNRCSGIQVLHAGERGVNLRTPEKIMGVCTRCGRPSPVWPPALTGPSSAASARPAVSESNITRVLSAWKVEPGAGSGAFREPRGVALARGRRRRLLIRSRGAMGLRNGDVDVDVVRAVMAVTMEAIAVVLVALLPARVDLWRGRVVSGRG